MSGRQRCDEILRLIDETLEEVGVAAQPSDHQRPAEQPVTFPWLDVA
jgi:hypothetical protein